MKKILVLVIVFVAAFSQSSQAQSLLAGTTVNKSIGTDGALLKNGTDGLGFYQVTGSTVAKANTAYLPEKRTLLIDMESLDNPVGIEVIEETKANVKANAVYNLSGQMVLSAEESGHINSLPAGIYIRNNKKIIVK